MKHTILHKDAEAAAAYEDASRLVRERYRQWQDNRRRYGPFARKSLVSGREFGAAAEAFAELHTAAAVVSSDELDAAEAMLHGMRHVVPQDEMGQ